MPKSFTSLTCASCLANVSCCANFTTVPLTIEDIDRISALGFSLEQIAMAEPYLQTDFSGSDEKWWKESPVIVNRTPLKAIIKTDKKGKCVFLKEGKGCSLGSKRPYACRIAPLWVDGKGSIIFDKDMHFCCILKSGMGVQEALNAIHETQKSIIRMHEKIKQDCIENKGKHKEILESISKQL